MQTFRKTQLQVLDKNGTLQDTYTLTTEFAESRTKPYVCANAGEIVLAVDWNPGDEEYLDIMATFAVDKEGGQFYRELHQDEIGSVPVVGEARYLRIDQSTFDDGVDGNPDSSADSVDDATASEPATHYCVAKFKVSGTHVRFRFRARRILESESPLDPGTIKVHCSLRV